MTTGIYSFIPCRHCWFYLAMVGFVASILSGAFIVGGLIGFGWTLIGLGVCGLIVTVSYWVNEVL